MLLSEELSKARVQLLELLLVLKHTRRTFGVLDKYILTGTAHRIGTERCDNRRQDHHTVACDRRDRVRGSRATIRGVGEWGA